MYIVFKMNNNYDYWNYDCETFIEVTDCEEACWRTKKYTSCAFLNEVPRPRKCHCRCLLTCTTNTSLCHIKRTTTSTGEDILLLSNASQLVSGYKLLLWCTQTTYCGHVKIGTLSLPTIWIIRLSQEWFYVSSNLLITSLKDHLVRLSMDKCQDYYENNSNVCYWKYCWARYVSLLSFLNCLSIIVKR